MENEQPETPKLKMMVDEIEGLSQRYDALTRAWSAQERRIDNLRLGILAYGGELNLHRNETHDNDWLEFRIQHIEKNLHEAGVSARPEP